MCRLVCEALFFIERAGRFMCKVGFRQPHAAHLSALGLRRGRCAAQQHLQHADRVPQVARGLGGQLPRLGGAELPALRGRDAGQALGAGCRRHRVEVQLPRTAGVQRRDQVLHVTGFWLLHRVLDVVHRGSQHQHCCMRAHLAAATRATGSTDSDRVLCGFSSCTKK